MRTRNRSAEDSTAQSPPSKTRRIYKRRLILLKNDLRCIATTSVLLCLSLVATRCADGRIGINGTCRHPNSIAMVNEQTWIAGHQAAKGPTLAGAYAAAGLTASALIMPSESLQATSILVAGFLMLAGVLWELSKELKRQARTGPAAVIPSLHELPLMSCSGFPSQAGLVGRSGPMHSPNSRGNKMKISFDVGVCAAYIQLVPKITQVDDSMAS